MKYLLLYLLTFCLAGTAIAQTPIHKKKAKTSKSSAQAKTTPVLTFERTVCLGTCPAYVVSVFADGRVAYDGRLHVPVMGKKEFKLEPAVVAEMLRMAQEAHFSTLEPRYSTGITDVPATIVAVRQSNGQLKTVIVESGPPEALQGMLGYLYGQFDPLAGLTEGR